jgi:hypothetical protein
MDREPEVVQLYNRGYEVQAETQARRVSYLVRPVETTQHSMTLAFAYAATGISHAQDNFTVAVNQPDFHPPAGGSIFDGVIDEIGDSLDQQISVATNA